MITFSQTESPISLADIKKVENRVGLNFPKEYVAHLLKYNGGQCSPNIFTFNENGRVTTSSVDWFLAIYDGEHDNLYSYIQDYKLDVKRMPVHILPIAHDPGGNLICISCGVEDYGSIYFWDHEQEIDYSISGDDNYKNLYLIANSFITFLDNLEH